MKKILLLMVMMASVIAGYAQKKTLVLYYSETGTTKTVAQELQKQLGADIEEVEAVVPYTGIFQETIQRGQREMQSGEMPTLKPLKKQIFDTACSSYQFPLGTPKTVGKRSTSESTDYKYTVASRGMNGAEGTSIIYVTVGKEKSAKPEFTEVVR